MVDANGDILKSGGTVFIRVSDPQNKELQVIKPLRLPYPRKNRIAEWVFTQVNTVRKGMLSGAR